MPYLTRSMSVFCTAWNDCVQQKQAGNEPEEDGVAILHVDSWIYRNTRLNISHTSFDTETPGRTIHHFNARSIKLVKMVIVFNANLNR